MAWTAPRTWVPDFIMRAADLNEQLRDNLLALKAEKLDTSALEPVVAAERTAASATYPAALVLTADPAALDNAVAITARLADAAASTIVKRVYVPPGVFLTSGSHAVPANVELFGPGTLKRTGPSAATLLTVAAGATVRGVTLDGSAVCVYDAQVSGDRVTFDGAKLINSDLYGIGCAGFSDLLVRGCEFLNNDSYGVLIEGASARCRILGNTVRTTRVGNGQGFFMKSTGTGNTIRPVDGIIANNVVDVRGIIGIEYWGDRGSITGNVVRCGAGTIGISLAICSETTVSGNTVVASAPAASFGIEVAENTRSCTVTGNTIVGVSIGVIISKGSRVDPSRYITVSGNTICRTTSYGIDTEFAEHCTISGNTIEDPTDTAIRLNNGTATAHNLVSGNTISRKTSPGSAITVTGSHVSVVDNKIDHSAKPSGQGIAYGGGANFGLISGNTIVGCSDGIVVSGTYTYINGNMTRGTTGFIINMGAAADFNVVGAHYGQNDGGAQINIVGPSSRLIGPVFSVGLNRAETRGRIGFQTADLALATTPGAVVRKVEVFDQAGASIGFVPIYSSIT